LALGAGDLELDVERVGVVLSIHWPSSANASMTMKKVKTTLAQPEVRTCFAPQLGQASALVLMLCPHSLHLVIAIYNPPIQIHT